MRILGSRGIALGIVLHCAVAPAATVRLLPLKRLARQAELIVVATAGARASRWEGTRIVTEVELSLEEVWEGTASPGETLKVVTLGGVVDEIGQRVDGAARLPSGERCVLFLGGEPGWRLHVVAMEQGHFRLASDPQARVWVVPPALTARVVGPRETQGPMPFEAFKKAVMEARRGD